MSSNKKSKKKDSTATKNSSAGFTDHERSAMKERARELKAEARTKKKKGDGEKEVLEKIAEMQEPDRTMAKRLHELITKEVPDLWSKTWYGMPAYALDGKVVCFFQSASKFDARYSTFGFNDTANLDDGTMWATAFALTELTGEAEDRIIALVKKAVS